MIVVDTSPFFHGPMLATLDRTDELLLLCGLDVPTMKNVRLGAADARAALVPERADRIVLNRANTNVGLKRARSRRRSGEGALRAPVGPRRADGGQPRQAGGPRRSRAPTSRRPFVTSRSRGRQTGPSPAEERPRKQKTARRSSPAAVVADGSPGSPQDRPRSGHGAVADADALATPLQRPATRGLRRPRTRMRS